MCGDNFLVQSASEPTRGGTLLDLLFVIREELVGDVMIGGLLGYGYHEMIEFSIPKEVRREYNRTATLDYQRANFGPLRKLVDRVP